MILGVTNDRPRRVVGTAAFPQPERTRKGLCEQMPLGFDFEEIAHPDGRVLAFYAPSRPVGIPIQYDGRYWMREQDSLVEMSAEKLRRIFAESGHDFSADICSGLTIEQLDADCIEDFRRRWIAKARKAEQTELAERLAALTPEQLLEDAEALVDGGLNYAALILFGTPQAVSRHLAQAEVVFEYRSSDASGPAQDRQEYRRGFFGFYDELWNRINLWNDKQDFQEGLFVRPIPTFNERAAREAVLNAVSHRDYQLGGCSFMLSRKFCEFVGDKGAYTRRKGLDREQTGRALSGVARVAQNSRPVVAPDTQAAELGSSGRRASSRGLVSGACQGFWRRE